MQNAGTDNDTLRVEGRYRNGEVGDSDARAQFIELAGRLAELGVGLGRRSGDTRGRECMGAFVCRNGPNLLDTFLSPSEMTLPSTCSDI